jgi:hypothetical protein
MQKNTSRVETKFTRSYQVSLKVRRFLYVTIFSLILTTVSYADIVRTGPNSFVAGINTNEFEYFVAPEIIGIQRQDMWCWAASIQMVLNYHGLYVTQERIVQIIKGQVINDGGTHEEMMIALNNWGIDNQGRYRVVRAFSDGLTYADIINNLAFKYPLIAERSNGEGRMGHVVVLTAVSFHYVATWNGYGYVNTPILDRAIFRDPWGRGTESRQDEDWSTFQSRLKHLDQVFVTR